MDEENVTSSARARVNQVQPAPTEEVDRELSNLQPPSEQKIVQLRSLNQRKSEEELKFSSSPIVKGKGLPRRKPGKSKKKNQRVNFNEQINKVHLVENWKTYNMENSVNKNGSHCCRLM